MPWNGGLAVQVLLHSQTSFEEKNHFSKLSLIRRKSSFLELSHKLVRNEKAKKSDERRMKRDDKKGGEQKKFLVKVAKTSSSFDRRRFVRKEIKENGRMKREEE